MKTYMLSAWVLLIAPLLTQCANVVYAVENHEQDTSPSHYKFNYGIGDSFVLLKPMYVVKSDWITYVLQEPDYATPTIEEYLKGIQRHDEVVLLLETGSKITLLERKWWSISGPEEHFKVPGFEKSVIAIGLKVHPERSDPDHSIRFHYDTSLLKRVESRNRSVDAVNTTAVPQGEQ